jgi:opacity protein-like surface antigen
MKKIGVLAGLLLLLASPVLAASGFYLGSHGGLLLVDDSRNDRIDSSTEGRFIIEFDPGAHAAAVLGYNLADAFPRIGIGRIELEAALRQSDLDKISFLEGGPLPAGGKVRVESLMFNTFGEHRESLPWLPYVGAGAGVARLKMQNVSTLGGPVVDDDDTVFAWQAGAGLGYQAFRHLAFDLGYRYFQAVHPKFTDTAGFESRARYRAHSFILGARLMF